jgi:hypothetical protein
MDFRNVSVLVNPLNNYQLFIEDDIEMYWYLRETGCENIEWIDRLRTQTLPFGWDREQ